MQFSVQHLIPLMQAYMYRDISHCYHIYIVREFLFLICVQKTIPMKILVLCVINSSRNRKRFEQGFIYELFVSKALTRSYLARSSFWHKQLVN